MSVVVLLQKEFLCGISVFDEEDYQVFSLPEIRDNKYKLRSCFAKEVADEINSLFADRIPSTVTPLIYRSEHFKAVDKPMSAYSMKDGSVLVWVSEWMTWGFVYPAEYVYYGVENE